MPDGISLSARVWMPQTAQSHPVPAILEILPYRKRDGTTARDETTHAAFAPHGYACLRVDLRGCGESEGLFDDEYSLRELEDIFATIQWIADQGWCTGAVGIMGISWGGFNGLQVAAMTPPALKAVISICATADRFADDIHYKGGCQLTENIGWAACAMSWFSMPPDPALVGDGWRETWLTRLKATPNLAPVWTGHANRDAYWQHGSVCEDYSAIKAAVLTIGGWHDGYRNTPAQLLANLECPVKAIVGPWNHKYPHLAAPEPRIDFVHEALRWWDHWLKGHDTGVQDDPAYRAYLMESVAPLTSFDTRPGRWIGLASLEEPDVTMKALAFNGTQLAPTAGPVERRVVTDTACGTTCGKYFPFGFGPGELPDDQSADDALSLCFDTQPLAGARDLVGAVQVKLRLAADRPRAQVAVRLCDLRPDGTSALISHGFLNLRHRQGFGKAVDLIPGTTYEVEVMLDQCAYRLPAGHRLRIALSPSYWPFIWPEAEPVTLTCTGGTVALPVWTGVSLPVDLRALHPVETSKTHKQTRGTVEQQDRVVLNKVMSLRIDADHGEVENLAHGLRNASSLSETWSIAQDDPASASATLLWERSMARADWSVRTCCETRMTTDATSFHIQATLTAFEGDEIVLERHFNDSVPR
ncbi:MAG: putative CocE/NonD family hydrolase [Paracoccaceae bacterium]|jgi:putative CocE/NonD family hydrolase